MRRRALIASLLACAGVAVLVPQVGAGQDVCTEIGCNSAIHIGTSLLREQDHEARTVRACALGRCKENRAGDGFQIRCGDVQVERTARIRVAVFDDDGALLWRDATTIHIKRSQPNGPDCPPTCFQAHVRLLPHQQIVAPR